MACISCRVSLSSLNFYAKFVILIQDIFWSVERLFMVVKIPTSVFIVFSTFSLIVIHKQVKTNDKTLIVRILKSKPDSTGLLSV